MIVSEPNYDLVIIGGGTGGYVAAIRASQLGLKVAVVERSKIGGTCLHQGCIPSKALLRSAEVLATAREAEQFGVEHSAPTLNLGRAMLRKDKIVQQLHKGVQFLMKKNGVDVIEGTGRVMGPSIFSPQAGAVSVEFQNGDTQILTPRYTLVATGSLPKSLPGLDIDGIKVISSDHALQLERLPESIIIVGAGAIGVEWASMLSDFGVKVTLVEYLPAVLPLEDADVSAELGRILKKRKVSVMTGAKVLADTLDKSGTGVRIDVQRDQAIETLAADLILVAVGRRPVVEGIGLEATEIQLENGAIVVDQNYRTKELNIFAIGDVIGGLQLAHVAAHEGIHAVEVMAGHAPKPIDYESIARCTYSRPEVASFGLTEKQAKEKGYSVKVGKFQFRAIGKALVFGESDGFVKVVSDADTDDLLGVHMIGPHVTDLITETALAKVLDATPWEIAQTIHPHPTLSEAIGEAALAVDGEAIHA
jgi:dihydrolipoamide dehydrogenase